MRILVTGANGFIAKNLLCVLREYPEYELMEYHFSLGRTVLEEYCQDADFVFHLAGVNRPELEQDFILGNVRFTEILVNALKACQNSCPILFSSSIHAEQENAYGKSKRLAETILLRHACDMGTRLAIYRLPNVFGKWCRPNYNSVVATFCHNIARGLPIHIENSSHVMELVFIDDVVNEFMLTMKEEGRNGFCRLNPQYQATVGELAKIIGEFPYSRKMLGVPNQADPFLGKLYSTYLSYLSKDSLAYDLTMHMDSRGSFTEFLRTKGQGQFSVNISHPHIVKGNHYHHFKHEKFLVVSGEGVIRLRRLGDEEVLLYSVSGRRLQVVEIPPGYTHNIENTGEEDMVTLMWVNECFNPEHPDTWPMEV